MSDAVSFDFSGLLVPGVYSWRPLHCVMQKFHLPDGSRTINVDVFDQAADLVTTPVASGAFDQQTAHLVAVERLKVGR